RLVVLAMWSSITLPRTKNVCLLLMFQSMRATLEFRCTGVGALKRKPAVLSSWLALLSPTVKSLATYLAEGQATAVKAAGLMPSDGKMGANCAVVRVVTVAAVPQLGVASGQVVTLSCPLPRLASGTTRTTLDWLASRRAS